jgi:hypothetical protein
MGSREQTLQKKVETEECCVEGGSMVLRFHPVDLGTLKGIQMSSRESSWRVCQSPAPGTLSPHCYGQEFVGMYSEDLRPSDWD